ncbi:MAG: cache domain-containing protein [Zoogloeaceae bacterium]|jgi:methyl-accepting chemotaxis protein|nr:cache domain-containing protein [Zoogloeaceae bacterium]
MSLKQHLPVFVASSLIMVMAILLGVTYWQMRTEIITDVSHEVKTVIRNNRAIMERWVTERRDAIEAVTDSLASAEDPIPFLITANGTGHFDQTFIGYEDKRMIYHLAEKKQFEGYDPTTRPWYRQANEEKGTIVTAPYLSASTGELCITVARPVPYRIPGVVGGDISLTEIIGLVNSIGLRSQGYAFLSTIDGKIVAYPRPGSALKPVTEIIPGFDISILKTASDEIVLHEFRFEGVPKYVSASPIPGTDWVLSIVVDKTTALAPLRSPRRWPIWFPRDESSGNSSSQAH